MPRSLWKCSTIACASARGGLPISFATSMQKFVVQSPCEVSRGIAKSRRARRSGLARPADASARATSAFSSFHTKVHAPGVAPQPLEEIVLARLLVEDVDDDVHEVEQHPAAPLAALHVPGLDAEQ